MGISKMITILLAVFFLVNSNGISASTVSFSPSESTATSGQAFVLNIVGNDFLNDVDGGGINLAFDKAIFKVESVSVYSDLWEFLPDNGRIDNAAGVVQEIQFNTFSQHNKGTFNIASLRLTALTPGESQFLLSESQVNPFASAGQAINPTFIAGKITVLSAVPVPAALWLMLGGLGVLGFAGKPRG